MKEQKLQDYVLNLIKENMFVDKIKHSKGNIDQILKQEKDEDFIPNFQVDYLLNYRYAKSVERVLKVLEGEIKIITGEEIKNISLDKRERLYPDYLLVNQETNEFVVMELKINKEAEREGLTEIMAYSHELKNTIPFIAESNISHIFICKDFNTVLEHSIARLILGTDYNILCLKVNVQNEAIIGLDVHIPESWTSTNIPYLKEENFVSRSLTFYDYDENITEENEDYIISTVLDLVNRKAERNNVSGFCLLWKNHIAEKPIFTLSIFVINSYDIGAKLYDSYSNPLVDFLKESVDELYLKTPNIVFSLGEDALEFLKSYCNPDWEEMIDLQDFKNNYRLNAEPLLVNSWGHLGDFIRYFYFHPGARKHQIQGFISCEKSYDEPDVFFAILNYITRSHLFSDGHFYLGDIFKLGVKSSVHFQVSRICEESTTVFNNTWMFWNQIEYRSIIIEILAQLEGLDNSNPPTKPNEEKYSEFIESFNNWIINDFLDDIAKGFFNLGYMCGLYLDKNIQSRFTCDDFEVAEAKKELIRCCKENLEFIANEFFINKELPIDSSIERHLRVYFGSENITGDLIEETLKELKDDFILSNYGTFIEVINIGYPEIRRFINFGEINVESVDFEWLKKEVMKKRKEGNYISAIEIKSNLEIQLGDLPSKYSSMTNEKLSENEIYLIMNFGAGEIINKTTWDELPNVIRGK